MFTMFSDLLFYQVVRSGQSQLT